ncbi:MAG: ribosome recycling factor [Gemmatimonadota bacterium]|nr:ribosome recycling factor [Gemmatimonadota bacterium]
MSLKETEERMDAGIDALRREFATVRTGKATPVLLDTVRVDAYGSKMPLNQLANISTPDASLLVVQPYDKTLLVDIEKAIQTANLGLNPANDGNLIRIPVPPLTEERRKEYAKLLHQMAEEGRISVRRARKISNDQIKQAIKDHETGEDEGFRQLEKIQEMTNSYSSLLDEMLENKEKEVMAL